MNYATIAERHWRTFRPAATAKMKNPEAFFRALAARVEQRVNDLTDELLAKQETETDYLARVEQIDAANRQAEEIVLDQEVFLPPEPGAADNELPPLPSRGPSTTTENPTPQA